MASTHARSAAWGNRDAQASAGPQGRCQASSLHLASRMERDKPRRAPWRRLVRGARGSRRRGLGIALERFSRAVTEWGGTAWAFAVALAVIVGGAGAVPVFAVA